MIPTHDQQEHKAWYWAIRPPEAQGRRVLGGQLAAVLAALDLDDDIDPRDVTASAFSERRWALLSARADREVFGHPNLGIVQAQGLGWVVVTDLRPALAAALGGKGEQRHAVDEHPVR